VLLGGCILGAVRGLPGAALTALERLKNPEDETWLRIRRTYDGWPPSSFPGIRV
jgi:hypothetical protein